ncbi:MAG: phage major capsid protein [Anaerolineae bacterium]|nr:phage major capsid protein [Anaerolineae bacterium]
MITYQEKYDESRRLLKDAMAILGNPDATAEEKTNAGKMHTDSKALMAEGEQMQGMVGLSKKLADFATNAPIVDQADPARPQGFGSFGAYLKAIHTMTFEKKYDPRLTNWRGDSGETPAGKTGESGWAASESKDLVESIGASGGFLVPTEYRPTLQMYDSDMLVVRPRAQVIPMRRRSVQMPVLDQTGGASDTPGWFGGLLAKWTEEAASKTESEPSFKQIELVAHKLVLYTEASDELLDDSAVSLEALLMALYRGAINWYEERAFVRGTGVGQPLGLINAGATITVARQPQLVFVLVYIINMLENFRGQRPVWMITQAGLSNLLQLNGPAANPSYVFMPSARDGVPGTLFGYPVFYNEHCSAVGVAGDVILADWSKYLIGDRQAISIDSSKHFRFQNDITAWRAVHRVDGQPWLSDYFTLADGTATVSPFVILGDKTT